MAARRAPYEGELAGAVDTVKMYTVSDTNMIAINTRQLKYDQKKDSSTLADVEGL